MSERKLRQHTDAQLSQDYKDVFLATPQGRRVLADIMAAARVFAPVDSNDPYEIARRNGERNIACRVATYCAYHPADFVERAIETTRELEELFNQSRAMAAQYPN